MKSFKLMWVLLLTMSLAACQPIRAPSEPSSEGGSTETRIANAMSAALPAVSRHATIVGYDETSMPTVMLRKGTNGWTCYEDWPASPDNDPVCYDSVFNSWHDDLLAHKDPQINGFGIAYKLKGGAIPSLTDPFATAPVEGKAWSSTSMHVMILSPNGFSATKYATKPSQDDPFIVWDGTPYEYLLAPLPPITAVQIPTLDDSTAQEVLLAEQELNYAGDFVHDIFTEDQIFADEYKEPSTSSTDTKAKKLEWIKSGIYQGKQAEFANVTVKVEGDKATADYTIYFTGTYDGRPIIHEPAHTTNVWVKRDGRWQIVEAR